MGEQNMNTLVTGSKRAVAWYHDSGEELPLVSPVFALLGPSVKCTVLLSRGGSD